MSSNYLNHILNKLVFHKRILFIGTSSVEYPNSILNKTNPFFTLKTLMSNLTSKTIAQRYIGYLVRILGKVTKKTWVIYLNSISQQNWLLYHAYFDTVFYSKISVDESKLACIFKINADPPI